MSMPHQGQTISFSIFQHQCWQYRRGIWKSPPTLHALVSTTQLSENHTQFDSSISSSLKTSSAPSTADDISAISKDDKSSHATFATLKSLRSLSLPDQKQAQTASAISIDMTIILKVAQFCASNGPVEQTIQMLKSKNELLCVMRFLYEGKTGNNEFYQTLENELNQLRSNMRCFYYD
jgi:hypothetical protein